MKPFIIITEFIDENLLKKLNIQHFFIYFRNKNIILIDKEILCHGSISVLYNENKKMMLIERFLKRYKLKHKFVQYYNFNTPIQIPNIGYFEVYLTDQQIMYMKLLK